MEKYLMYIFPVFAFAMLTAGWMAVQLLARKVGTKNHIEDGGGCCGACEKKDTCTKGKETHNHAEIN